MRSQVRDGVCFFAACLIAVSVMAQETPTPAPAAAPDKAKSFDAVKAYVAEAAKSGKKVKVWVNAFGSPSKVELGAADAKKITVVVENNPFDLTWEKLSQKDIINVAKTCVLEDGKRALL